ncbi:MAG: P22 phage major capsid protein family protein [Candidatus Saccharimonadales bacterium]
MSLDNVLLTPSLLTKLTLMNLTDNLYVCRNMSTAYTANFGQNGNKIGDSFQIRKPQRFEVTSGMTYSQQALTDQSTTITVNDVAGVHFQFDSKERTLSLDFINDRYAKPAAIALANYINSQAAQFIAQNTWNMVGTPGTSPTDLATYLQAEDLLVAQGCPQNEQLTAIINRQMSSAFIGSSTITGMFNSQDILSQQHRTGRVQNQLGYNWEIDQTIYKYTTGAQGGTPLVSAAPTEDTNGNNGTSSIVLKGLSASITGIIKAGDTLTFASVNSVYPQTRVDTGYSQQYVALADATSNSSGVATVTVAPGFCSATATNVQQQNITALPAANAAVTINGGSTYASKASSQGLLLHPDAFAFMSVPLENPEANGVEMVAQETDPDTGAVLSFIRYFDGDSRTHKNRFDMLYGFGKLYPELACRIAGA